MVFYDKIKRVVNFIFLNLYELRNKIKVKSIWFKLLLRKIYLEVLVGNWIYKNRECFMNYFFYLYGSKIYFFGGFGVLCFWFFFDWLFL